jgi:putative RNA 2'-phosphotransferase
MDNTRLVKVSKYLSKHLRHQPERLGLTLAPGGWVDVEVLLDSCQAHHFPLTRAELEVVVSSNDKQRFAFDPTGQRIRANQGHSVAIDLQLEATVPPPELYHGTAEHNVSSILKNGLQKMARHHVHLTADMGTAMKVGARHGKPVIFVIHTAAMVQANYEFYVSANGVWLLEHVPPEYLQRL